MVKRVYKNSRHLRWNWEKSPDVLDAIRYHIVIVDDRDREGILNKIHEQIGEWGYIDEVRKRQEGKVKETKFRYLFSSFDTDQKPEMIDFYKIGKPVKRDKDLRERKIGSIEDYVSRIYE